MEVEGREGERESLFLDKEDTIVCMLFFLGLSGFFFVSFSFIFIFIFYFRPAHILNGNSIEDTVWSLGILVSFKLC